MLHLASIFNMKSCKNAASLNKELINISNSRFLRKVGFDDDFFPLCIFASAACHYRSFTHICKYLHRDRGDRVYLLRPAVGFWSLTVVKYVRMTGRLGFCVARCSCCSITSKPTDCVCNISSETPLTEQIRLKG